MDGKLLARIGAAVFVGIAVAMTLVQLHEEPEQRVEEAATIWVPDGDPLPAQLRVCAQMGELALSSSDCRAVWAEKRRRFFGVDHPDAYPEPVLPDPPMSRDN
jgi:conjugative transfer region protein TrbK